MLFRSGRLLAEPAAARFEAVQVGLRPLTRDELPIIGASSTRSGVFYATGHYRNGILLAPVTLIDINMGLAVALKAFAAAVLGGFGSIPGALVGGLTIGLIELYSGATLPEGFKDTMPYIVLLVMLWVRPQGMFGTLGRKKV